MDTSDLRAATDQVTTLLEAAAPDRFEAATPCDEWDARALVGHLVAGNDLVTRALGGEVGVPGDADGADGAAGPADDYARSAAGAAAAFELPGALERPVEIPFGTVPGSMALALRVVETLVHGWDLAQAWGVPVRFDPQVVAQAQAFSESALGQIPPERSPFGPAQPCPDDAPPVDRLAALLGRTPLHA